MKSSFRVENTSSEIVESALCRVYWRKGFSLVPYDPSTIIAGFAITLADEGNNCLVATKSIISDLVAVLHFIAICSNILIWIFLGFLPFLVGISLTTAVLLGIPYLVNKKNNQIIQEILSDKSFLSEEFDGIRFANRGLVDYLEHWLGMISIPFFLLFFAWSLSWESESLFFSYGEELVIILADAFVLGILIVMALPFFFLLGLVYAYGHYFWTKLTKQEAEELKLK